jgi:hypothetical protein
MIKRISSLLFICTLFFGAAVFAAEDGLVTKAEKGVTKGAEAAAKGIEKGVDATAKGVQKGVDATGRGLQKANEWIEEKLFKSRSKSDQKAVEKP